MIISGYQGIGKSSLGGKIITVNGYKTFKFLDLESSLFKNENGERDKDWYKAYVNIAISLHEQGYTVFISSHDIVRNYIADILTLPLYENLRENNNFNNDVFGICYPSLKIEEEWIKKLKERFYRTNLDKDKFAYKGALKFYKDNILDLKKFIEKYNLKDLEIKNMDYNLEDLIIDTF